MKKISNEILIKEMEVLKKEMEEMKKTKENLTITLNTSSKSFSDEAHFVKWNNNLIMKFPLYSSKFKFLSLGKNKLRRILDNLPLVIKFCQGEFDDKINILQENEKFYPNLEKRIVEKFGEEEFKKIQLKKNELENEEFDYQKEFKNHGFK